MSEERSEEKVVTRIPPRLDRMPLTSWHYYILLVLGSGLFLEGFSVSVAGSQLGTIVKLLSLNTLQALSVTPIFLIGELFGAVILGHLADTRGRKLLFLTSLAIIMIGDVLVGILFIVKGLNYYSLVTLRAITGFGVGGEFGASIAALQEFTPARIRGVFTGTGNAVLFDLGTVVASLVAALLLSILPISLAVGTAFVIGVIIAVAIYVGRIGLPESPRFLLSKGRNDEAERIVSRIEETAKQKGLTLSEVQPVELDFARGTEAGGYRRLFTTYRNRLILAWTLNFTETWPYYSAFSVISLILTKVFLFPGSKVALLLAAMTGAGVIGVFVMSWALDVIGRRSAITMSYGLGGLLSIIIGAVVKIIPLYVFLLLLVLLYFFVYAAAGVLYPQIGEMFPTKNRGSAMGTAVGFGRLGGIIAPFALAAYVGSISGLLPIFVITGVVMLIGAVAEILVGPELKRKSLEEAAKV
ncbi:MAG: MFS transporter [Nitrososphaerota archaeon]